MNGVSSQRVPNIYVLLYCMYPYSREHFSSAILAWVCGLFRYSYVCDLLNLWSHARGIRLWCVSGYIVVCVSYSAYVVQILRFEHFVQTFTHTYFKEQGRVKPHPLIVLASYLLPRLCKTPAAGWHIHPSLFRRMTSDYWASHSWLPTWALYLGSYWGRNRIIQPLPTWPYPGLQD